MKNVPKWKKIRGRETNQKKLAVIQLRDYSGLKSYGGSEDKDKETNGLINIFAYNIFQKETESRMTPRFLRNWVE